MASYYYDSYTIIEFLDKNQKYKEYFTEHRGILTALNLMEVSYSLQKHFGFRSTAEHLEPFLPYVVTFDLSDIDAAMKLRLALEKNKKLNISYVDALGYHLAKKHNVLFLTGDRHFKGLDNVEFVK
ncbi:putative PIN domain protein [Candidatus Nitrososphaera gargensis Ga9.2]|uniref:Putative PIN domain protein n=1 Tax=Nitrososphaera gargensis (strain Ga9.2) TaxID=1237085 RepID=K0IDR4_NITGG|nr:PIN domain-containing protein [Candidatus Nitrososphaera gargensis]AFU57860.1 putative PIN domain protein [Candidatus Nitrososphaera gargensis Ga9.2]